MNTVHKKHHIIVPVSYPEVITPAQPVVSRNVQERRDLLCFIKERNVRFAVHKLQKSSLHRDDGNSYMVFVNGVSLGWWRLYANSNGEFCTSTGIGHGVGPTLETAFKRSVESVSGAVVRETLPEMGSWTVDDWIHLPTFYYDVQDFTFVHEVRPSSILE